MCDTWLDCHSGIQRQRALGLVPRIFRNPTTSDCSLNFDTAFSENKLTLLKWAVRLFLNRDDHPVFLDAKFRTV